MVVWADALAIVGLIALFYWSIYPFLGEPKIPVCRECGEQLSRYGFCCRCRRYYE
jgi:hypothetical protein